MEIPLRHFTVNPDQARSTQIKRKFRKQPRAPLCLGARPSSGAALGFRTKRPRTRQFPNRKAANPAWPGSRPGAAVRFARTLVFHT